MNEAYDYKSTHSPTTKKRAAAPVLYQIKTVGVFRGEQVKAVAVYIPCAGNKARYTKTALNSSRGVRAYNGFSFPVMGKIAREQINNPKFNYGEFAIIRN